MGLHGFEQSSLIGADPTARVRRDIDAPTEQMSRPTPPFQRVNRRKPGARSLVVRQGPSRPRRRPPTPPGKQPWTEKQVLVSLVAGLLVAAVVVFGFGGDDDNVETASEVLGEGISREIAEPEEDFADGLEEEQSGLQRAVERLAEEGADTPLAEITTAAPSTIPEATPTAPEPIVDPDVELDFVAESGGEGAEQNYTFRSTSVGSTTVAWDFGDGNTGTGASVFHNYVFPAIYTVTMTAQGAGGTERVTQDITVLQTTGLVEAGFVAGVADPSRGQRISFTNTSHEDFQTFFWDFGDGNTSNQPAPTHSYNRSGDYTVVLTATMADGTTDSILYSIRVAANQGNLEASFTSFASDAPRQQTMNFRANTEGNANRFDWDYGDGNRGSGASPDHTYAASGTYTVTLRVRNSDGQSDTTSQQVTVQRNG